MGGGSLSLSTSPHRRSLEALGLLHNPGGRSSSLRVGDVDVYFDVDAGRIGKKNCFKVVPHTGRPPSRALSSRSLSGLGLYAYIVKIARYPLHCMHWVQRTLFQDDLNSARKMFFALSAIF